MGSYVDLLFRSGAYTKLTSFGPYDVSNASSTPLNNVKTKCGTCHEQFKKPNQVCSGRKVHYQNVRDWRHAANGIIGGVALLGLSLILRPLPSWKPKLVVPQGNYSLQTPLYSRMIKPAKGVVGLTGVVLAAIGMRHLLEAKYSREDHKRLMTLST